MLMKMFCIYDRKSEAYHPPGCAHSAGHALRNYSDVFRNPATVFCTHPDDFQIYEIGTFDDATGVTTCIKPHLICTGTELKAEYNKDVNTLKGNDHEPSNYSP